MIDKLVSAVGFGDGVREFALIRRRGQPEDPSKIKSYNRKKSPHEIEIEENLPVGRYNLQVIKENGNFGDRVWSETLFGDTDELKDRVERAERAAAEAREEASSGSSSLEGFEDPQDRLKYQIQRTIVEDERLVEKFGDELVKWALNNGLSPHADVEISSLPALVGYRSFEEPARAGELAEEISRGVSRGLAGDGDEAPDSVGDAFSSATDEGEEEIEALEDAGESGSSLAGTPSTTGPTVVGEASGAFASGDGEDAVAGEVATGNDAEGLADGAGVDEGEEA